MDLETAAVPSPQVHADSDGVERPEYIEQFTTQAVWDGQDPTSTKTIRSRWSAEMYRRFRALKGVIREAVVDNDVLGLREDAPEPTVVQPGRPQGTQFVASYQSEAFDAREYGRSLAANQARIGPDGVRPPYPGAFNFPTDEDKVEAFMGWLREQERIGILEITEAEGREVVSHTGWQNTYVRSAYRRGMEKGTWAMKTAGIEIPGEDVDVLFRSPQHADALGLLYTRTFQELDGITSAMDQDISRTLVEGLARGWNPNKTARELNDRVGAVGLHRARVMARTETVRSANEAALNRYEDLQRRIGGVTAAVEFSTAGDDRVCPECLLLEGQVYDIVEARGVIPVHPNCRCMWLPVPEGKKQTVSPINRSPDEAVKALPHALPNPAVDYSRFIDRMRYEQKVGDVVRAQSPSKAGLTFNSNLTDFDGDGYIVSVASKNLSKDAGDELTARGIAEFYQNHQPIIQRYPGVKIGVFNDIEGDLISIDLNAVLHSKEEAIRLAKQHNQMGIWDAYKGRYIPTGGTGEATLVRFLDIMDTLEDVDSWTPTEFAAVTMAPGTYRETGDEWADQWLKNFREAEVPPPRHLNPYTENVDEVIGVRAGETAGAGVNADNMRVIKKANGERLLLKEYSEAHLGDTAPAGDIASRFMRRIDPEIAPETYRPPGSKNLVISWVDGKPLENYIWGDPDKLPDIGRDSILDTFASGLITHNRDMHRANVFYTKQGKLVSIDNDLAMFHLSNREVRLNESRRFWERWSSMNRMLDIDIDRDELLDRAVEIARDFDIDSFVEELRTAGYDDEWIGPIVRRIEEARERNFEGIMES